MTSATFFESFRFRVRIIAMHRTISSMNGITDLMMVYHPAVGRMIFVVAVANIISIF